MDVSLLAYDSESDELDLLIDEKSPTSAESIPVGEGIYIRRDPSSGRVVGACIRGYSHLHKKVHTGAQVSDEGAKQRGVQEAFQAVLYWIRHHTSPNYVFNEGEDSAKAL